MFPFLTSSHSVFPTRCGRWTSLLGLWHWCSSPLLNSGWVPCGRARTPHLGKGLPGLLTDKRKVNNIHFERKLSVTRFWPTFTKQWCLKSQKKFCMNFHFSWIFQICPRRFIPYPCWQEPTTCPVGGGECLGQKGGPWAHRYLPLCRHPGIHTRWKTIPVP